jgi:hypothetical protein
LPANISVVLTSYNLATFPGPEGARAGRSRSSRRRAELRLFDTITLGIRGGGREEKEGLGGERGCTTASSAKKGRNVSAAPCMPI